MTVMLKVVDIVGGAICVASEDGHKVHDKIAELMNDNEPIALSFIGVERLTTAFLNAAIGQLYNEFSETRIRDLLSVLDADKATLMLLKSVVDRAKVFYKARSSA